VARAAERAGLKQYDAAGASQPTEAMTNDVASVTPVSVPALVACRVDNTINDVVAG
jgi:hypothetical protein